MAAPSSSTLPAPICCDRNVPPGRSTRAIAGQNVARGWRLMTRSNASPRNGSSGPSAATTCAPRPRSRFAATETLGRHGSVATVSDGSAPTPASISPPPVSTSSSASTPGRRAATMRA
jgi:hypothetical protein